MYTVRLNTLISVRTVQKTWNHSGIMKAIHTHTALIAKVYALCQNSKAAKGWD